MAKVVQVDELHLTDSGRCHWFYNIIIHFKLLLKKNAFHRLH